MYNKIMWANGDTITAEKLNNLEDGVATRLPNTGGVIKGSGISFDINDDGIIEGRIGAVTRSDETPMMGIESESISIRSTAVDGNIYLDVGVGASRKNALVADINGTKIHNPQKMSIESGIEPLATVAEVEAVSTLLAELTARVETLEEV